MYVRAYIRVCVCVYVMRCKFAWLPCVRVALFTDLNIHSLVFSGDIQGPHSSGLVSFKYGSSSNASYPQSSFNDIKSLEWSPLEEAALLMVSLLLFTHKISKVVSFAVGWK